MVENEYVEARSRLSGSGFKRLVLLVIRLRLFRSRMDHSLVLKSAITKSSQYNEKTATTEQNGYLRHWWPVVVVIPVRRLGSGWDDPDLRSEFVASGLGHYGH